MMLNPGASRLPTPELRILVLSPWGIGGGYSGPVTFLNRLFSSVSQYPGVAIDVLYRDRGTEVVPDWVRRAIPIGRRSSASFARLAQLRWCLAARRYVRTNEAQYDVVHLHGGYWLNALAISRARRRRYAVAMTPVLEAGDIGMRRSGRWWSPKQRVLTAVVPSVDLGIALSPGIADELQSYGLGSERTVVISNPVDESRFAFAPKPAPTPEKVLCIGFVGKLGSNKNPHLVIEALSSLVNRGVDATAVFVGPFSNQQMEDTIRALVTSRGLSNRVKFVGFTANVERYLRDEIDIFVLPSAYEGMPGALAEAMMAGIPAVVTDVGSMAIHVSRAKAGLVSAPDGQAVADQIQRIWSNTSEWESMSRNAAQYAHDHFTSEGVAETYMQALNAVLRSQPCEPISTPKASPIG